MNRFALIATFLVAAPTVASAHIHLLQPASRGSAPLGDPQKTPHCGISPYTRDPAKVTYYKPGQTITVMWRETVSHMGWYRIAFQPNGATFSYPPPGPGPSNQPTVNQTGVTDAATGTRILLDRIADGQMGVTQMAQVTLPNMECNNCTLQFTQFMTDGGQAYNTGMNGSVYFNCADITLTNTPPIDAAPPPPPVDASVDAAPAADGDAKGGCSTSAGGTGALVIVLLGLLSRRRRPAR